MANHKTQLPIIRPASVRALIRAALAEYAAGHIDMAALTARINQIAETGV